MTALQWKERSEWGLWEKFPKAPFAPCGYCVETQKCHYWQWSQLPEYLPDFRATELRDCSYLCAHFLDEETGTVRLSFSNVKQLVKAELGFAHRLRWVLIAVFYFHSSLSSSFYYWNNVTVFSFVINKHLVQKCIKKMCLAHFLIKFSPTSIDR